MGVTKTTHQEGSGVNPVKGQRVTIEYTGFLKDTSKPGNKGNKFDSSVGRGDFVTSIGVGQVIRGKRSSALVLQCRIHNYVLTRPGWDEGVVQMKVGEKATLDITR